MRERKDLDGRYKKTFLRKQYKVTIDVFLLGLVFQKEIPFIWNFRRLCNILNSLYICCPLIQKQLFIQKDIKTAKG